MPHTILPTVFVLSCRFRTSGGFLSDQHALRWATRIVDAVRFSSARGRAQALPDSRGGGHMDVLRLLVVALLLVTVLVILSI